MMNNVSKEIRDQSTEFHNGYLPIDSFRFVEGSEEPRKKTYRIADVVNIDIPHTFLSRLQEHRDTYRNNILDYFLGKEGMEFCVKSCFLDLIVIHQLLFSEKHRENICRIIQRKKLRVVEHYTELFRRRPVVTVTERERPPEIECILLACELSWEMAEKIRGLSYERYNSYLLEKHSCENTGYFALSSFIIDSYETYHLNFSSKDYHATRQYISDRSWYNDFLDLTCIFQLSDFFSMLNKKDRYGSYINTPLTDIYCSGGVYGLLSGERPCSSDERGGVFREIKCQMMAHYRKQTRSLLGFLLSSSMRDVHFPIGFSLLDGFVRNVLKEYILDNFDVIFSCIDLREPVPDVNITTIVIEGRVFFKEYEYKDTCFKHTYRNNTVVKAVEELLRHYSARAIYVDGGLDLDGKSLKNIDLNKENENNRLSYPIFRPLRIYVEGTNIEWQVKKIGWGSRYGE